VDDFYKSIAKFIANIKHGINIVRKICVNRTYLDNELFDIVENPYKEIEETIRQIKFLLDKGANPNSKNEYGQTSLLSVDKIDVEIAKVFHLYGANLSVKDNRLDSLLHKAVESRNSDLVTYLLKNNIDPNTRDSNGQTALHRNAKSGDNEIAKILINFGAECNATDNIKRTPLHIAAQYDNTHFARELLNNKANIEAMDIYQETPIFYAVRHNSSSAAELLLDSGSAPSSKNKKGRSPLHLASILGYNDIVKLLLNYVSSSEILAQANIIACKSEQDKMPKIFRKLKKENLKLTHNLLLTPLAETAIKRDLGKLSYIPGMMNEIQKYIGIGEQKQNYINNIPSLN